jgi:hypothetical protein
MKAEMPPGMRGCPDMSQIFPIRPKPASPRGDGTWRGKPILENQRPGTLSVLQHLFQNLDGILHDLRADRGKEFFRFGSFVTLGRADVAVEQVFAQ